jgi:DNA-binding response OmpR family regulator
MDTESKCILLVEDDPTISDLLAYNLKRAGYEVLQEGNGRAGLEAALTHAVDLVLMDLMLPGLDGMTAAKEISRRKPSVPIIMLTARGERETMLDGFGAGADDYVTKPFDLDVLLARIAVHLRRAQATTSPAEMAAAAVVIEDLILDSDAHEIRTSHGKVALNPKEHDLFALFLSQPGHLFPREEIVQKVWHQRYSPASRTLDVHVRHVRSKLEQIGAQVTVLAVRGVGYRLGAV